MAGALLPEVFLRAIGSDGLAMSGAKLYFYLTGTTTPTNTYTSSTLGTPNANPVVADSGGLFAAIYLDPAVTYRVILKTSGGTTIQDIDPYASAVVPVEASAGEVTAGTATTVFISPRRAGAGGVTLIGYTPANLAGDTFTGAVKMSGTPATLGTTDLGFRGVPLTTHDATYTFVIDDAGKGALHTSGSAHTWTIPPVGTVAYPAGSTIVLVNTGGGAVTIARGAGVALRIAGSSTDGSKTLAQYGIATLFMPVSDSWYISGAGVS